MRLLSLFSLAALVLAACSGLPDQLPDQEPGTVRILCADVLNEGQTSLCDVTGVSALVETVAGDVSRGTTVTVSMIVENTTGTTPETITIHAFDTVCGPGFVGKSYSVISGSFGPLPLGISNPWTSSNCPEGEIGERRFYATFYEGNNTVMAGANDWTPGAFPEFLLDEAVTVFNLTP